MRRLLDLPLLLVAIASAPLWLTRMVVRGRHRTDWPGRLGVGPRLPGTERPRILLHAVSVGEVNAIRRLVPRLAERAEVVVAATTDTGFARAQSLFAPAHEVVRWPLDFHFAVSRFLDRVRPDVVGLVELEVWPMFTVVAAERGIPLLVVNGRLSERSHRQYRRIRAFMRPSFRRLDRVLVQNEGYERRFADLGVPRERIEVSGTMKWDAVDLEQAATRSDDAQALADQLGLDGRADHAPRRPLVVAGSTAPEETALLRDALPEGARLLIAPRRPEWFDDVAASLPGCVRRSHGERAGPGTRFIVLDTIGELAGAYELADVVVVGRSFGARHGSDMMEPAGLGKPVVAGPALEDFRTEADALEAGGGLVICPAAELGGVLAGLLEDPGRRRALAESARAVIRARQGATGRTAEVLLAAVDQAAADAGPGAVCT